MFKVLSLANMITISRIIVLYIAVVMIYTQEILWLTIAGGLSILIIVLDGLDGIVARRRNEVTQFGGILDITGDRIVENVFLVVFADLDVIPMWIPVIVISRGFIVDAIRSQALAAGKAAIGQNSMNTSAIGKFLVSSRFMRAISGLSKATAFPYLTLVLLIDSHLRDANLTEYPWISYYTHQGGIVLAITMTAVNLIRGIPVFIEGIPFIRKAAAKPTA